MDRMKTFLMYFLILLAFFFVSKILEDGLIKQMYYDMTGITDNNLYYNGQEIDMGLTVVEAKSTRRNGYIILTVKNEAEIDIDEAYIKVVLYSKSGVTAITKYMEISDLASGEEKEYKLNFGGSYITEYSVTFENDYPDKEYIINVLGYDINTSNLFGLGIDISEYVNAENFKSLGHTIWRSFTLTVSRIPAWAWWWAWMICVGVW